jgi:hypothetical protein
MTNTDFDKSFISNFWNVGDCHVHLGRNSPTLMFVWLVGKLTIQGLNLTGADIKAATFDQCITLNDFTTEFEVI